MEELSNSTGSRDGQAQRRGLLRLRQKIRDGVGVDLNQVHTEHDLIQLHHALAERQLDDQLRADLGDRERLTEAHLGVRWHEIAVVSAEVRQPHIKPVLRLIGDQLAEHTDVEFSGSKPNSPPRWDRFELADRVELVPGWATIFWDAGTVSDVPLVVQTWDDDRSGAQTVLVFSQADHDEAAKAYLDDLIARAKGSESPYRGRLLKASWAMWGVQLDVLTDPVDTREHLILPDEVWNALDLNVHRMFARMDAFRSAGLGSNRGLLLAGAPGTGKTAACRVLAAEVLGDVTAVFVDSRASQALLPQLYSEIAGMAPALVLLEDLDLVVGDRADGSARMALLDFLTVLDGLMTEHHDIVTVATTNDPDAVDAGVRRAARFDRIVTFPKPDERGRRRILDVYLRSVDHQVETEVVAKAAEGRTGADLRECVRAALLVASGPILTEDLIRAVEDRPAPEGDTLEPVSKLSNYL